MQLSMPAGTSRARAPAYLHAGVPGAGGVVSVGGALRAVGTVRVVLWRALRAVGALGVVLRGVRRARAAELRGVRGARAVELRGVLRGRAPPPAACRPRRSRGEYVCGELLLQHLHLTKQKHLHIGTPRQADLYSASCANPRADKSREVRRKTQRTIKRLNPHKPVYDQLTFMQKLPAARVVSSSQSRACTGSVGSVWPQPHAAGRLRTQASHICHAWQADGKSV